MMQSCHVSMGRPLALSGRSGSLKALRTRPGHGGGPVAGRVLGGLPQLCERIGRGGGLRGAQALLQVSAARLRGRERRHGALLAH